MRGIGNLLTIVGVILFFYTLIGRFVGDKTLLGFSKAPIIGEYLAGGFTAVGMFSGIACILLIAVIALIKSQE